jgi:beta-ribofuranosylaminobenzene 5'-phosphate synthase
MGFGSGTAIRLAAIEGLYLLNGYVYTSDGLIAASGRGGTSGVGVHTYFQGGYSFDVGRKSGVLAPSCSVESKYTKPLHIVGGEMPDWKIGICIPNSICPKSEAEEKEFFASTCPIEPHESYEATYHAVFGLLAGAKDGCLDSFCEAVRNIQQCKWKSAERSLYGDGLFEIEKALYDCGASAVGMSSLGPSLFFVGADIDTVCEKAKKLLDCNIFVTTPRNNGREIVDG